MTQKQMYYRAVRKAAEENLLFLQFVKDGLTRDQLAKLIARRPSIWGRFANRMPNLPQDPPTKKVDFSPPIL
jgi:hypothetical protein